MLNNGLAGLQSGKYRFCMDGNRLDTRTRNHQGFENLGGLKHQQTKKIVPNKKIFYIFVFAAMLLGMGIFTIPFKRQQKMNEEMQGIESKQHRTDKMCEQYALVAAVNGWFPCYNCGDKRKIYLNVGEVWKYGKTCNGKSGRYKGGLPISRLEYKRQFTGTEKECLLEEKRKIYNYPNLPECLKRDFVIIRPPGNKIDR